MKTLHLLIASLMFLFAALVGAGDAQNWYLFAGFVALACWAVRAVADLVEWYIKAGTKS